VLTAFVFQLTPHVICSQAARYRQAYKGMSVLFDTLTDGFSDERKKLVENAHG